MIFGRHRFRVHLVIDIMSCLWMIILNFCGHFLYRKNHELFSQFLHFKTFIRTQFEQDIKTIQCDNDMEFGNGPFRDFCKANGISFHLSCPHTSPQNEKAER